MLNSTLNTNEIKNAAGTEVEFSHLSQTGRSREFAQITEGYTTPNRLKIQHLETGDGIKKRRRSVCRFDKTVMSTVDTTLPVTISAYTVLDIPTGALVATTEAANVLAQLMSFMATTGSGTTVLFDCSGNGASVLLNGGL